MILSPIMPVNWSQSRHFILTAICFTLPMKVAFVYFFSAVLLLVWILEGHVRQQLRNILHSKLCMAFFAYFFIYFLSMLWTENIAAGWDMLSRQKAFLLFPLFWTCAEAKYRERYITGLIAGLVVCAILAHYNWAQLHWFPEWPRGIRVFKSAEDTAPFVDWIMYVPILSLGTYLCIRRIFLSATKKDRAIASLAAILLLSNLSFSGGRAGMVMFAVLLLMLVFELIKKRFAALIFSVIFFPLIFLTLYTTQEFFAKRVDVGISDLKTLDQNPHSSVSLRLIYWATTSKIFVSHPLIGVGAGDLKDEYARIKPEKWKTTPDSYNPHNQYLMTAATTGLLGLIPLFLIFYYAARGKCDLRLYAVLAGYAAVCIFESYLWRSNTAMTFSLLIAIMAEKTTHKPVI